jgi:hypothetical protein
VTRDDLARQMAEALCRGFRAHDKQKRGAAVRAFGAVDQHQFAHLDTTAAYDAAEAYVDALWAKDRLEEDHRRDDGLLDKEALADLPWLDVYDAFAERAEIVGIHPVYAHESTQAWKFHKTGDDYWTPMLAAQTWELRTAMQNDDYPDKAHHGRSGWGPEPARYLVGVELHDRHTYPDWEQAVAVMTPYYQAILDAHDSDDGGEAGD